MEPVSEIVAAIVRETVGLDRTRCREIVCATTDLIADRLGILELSSTSNPRRTIAFGCRLRIRTLPRSRSTPWVLVPLPTTQ